MEGRSSREKYQNGQLFADTTRHETQNDASQSNTEPEASRANTRLERSDVADAYH